MKTPLNVFKHTTCAIFAVFFVISLNIPMSFADVPLYTYYGDTGYIATKAEDSDVTDEEDEFFHKSFKYYYRNENSFYDAIADANYGRSYRIDVVEEGYLGDGCYLEFDCNDDDYIYCGNDSSFNLGNNFTLVARAKVNPGGGGYLISKRDGALSQYGMAIAPDTGRLMFVFGGDTPKQIELNHFTNDWRDGEWHEFAITIEEANPPSSVWVTGFVDGVAYRRRNSKYANSFLSKTDNTITEYGEVPFLIGARGDGEGGRAFVLDGGISDVKVYDRTLSPTEIEELNANNPISEGLVSYWDLQEGHGVAVPDKTGDNDGILNNSTWETAGYYWDITYHDENAPNDERILSKYKKNMLDDNILEAYSWYENELPKRSYDGSFLSEWVYEEPTNALNFNQSGDYVDMGTDFIGTGEVTISVWINTHTLGNYPILGNGKTNLFLNGSGAQARVVLQSDGVSPDDSEYGIITADEWFHIAVTRDASGDAVFYINGELHDYGMTGFPGQEATHNVLLGAWDIPDGGNIYDGMIGETMIYNRLLTSREISELYDGIAPESGVIAHWDFHEGEGTTLEDIAGEHDGTISVDALHEGETWAEAFPVTHWQGLYASYSELKTLYSRPSGDYTTYNSYITYDWDYAPGQVEVKMYDGFYSVSADDGVWADVQAPELRASYIYEHNNEFDELDPDTNGWELELMSTYDTSGNLLTAEYYEYEGQLGHFSWGKGYPSKARINNSGQAVWIDYNAAGDICYYDGTYTSQLTHDSYDDKNPQINNSGHVVWSGEDSPGDEIYYYNGADTIQLTDNIHDDKDPQINDSGHVVWRRNGSQSHEIYYYNGTDTIQLTDDFYVDYYPQINASGHVVWCGADALDYGIYYYDGTEVVKIASNALPASVPQINDSGHVVWHGSDTGQYDIYYYDGTDIIQLTDNSQEEGAPQINNSGHVVWYADSKIYYYNGTDIIQISDNAVSDSSPQISDSGYVVWSSEDSVEHDYEIYYYDGTDVVQLTDNSYLDKLPQINDGNEIVWIDDEGAGNENVNVYRIFNEVRTETYYVPSGNMESLTLSNADGEGNIYYHCIDEDWEASGLGRVDVSQLETANENGEIAFEYQYHDGTDDVKYKDSYTDTARTQHYARYEYDAGGSTIGVETYYASGNLRTAYPDYNDCVYTFLDENYWKTTIPQGRISRIDWPEDDPFDRESETFTYHGESYNVKRFERKYWSDGEAGINEFYDESFFTDNRMVIDSSGNIVEIGKIWNGVTNGWDSYIKKSTSNGTPLWSSVYTSTEAYDYPSAITVDGNDNIIAIVRHGSTSILKYDASGNLLWEETSAGPTPVDVVTDAAGNFYVTGAADNYDRFLTVKYDNSNTDPAVLWEAEYSTGVADGYAAAKDINIDDSGNIVVCGWIENTNLSKEGYRVIYDPSGNIVDNNWYKWKTIHDVGPDNLGHNTGRRSLGGQVLMEHSYGYYEQLRLIDYFPTGIPSTVISDPGYIFYFLDASLEQTTSGIFDFDEGGDVTTCDLIFDQVEGELVNIRVIKGIYSSGNTAWFLWGDNVYQDEASQWHDNVVLEYTGAENWNVYEFNSGADYFQPLITADWTTVESISGAEALSLPLQELGNWEDWIFENRIVPEYPATSIEYFDDNEDGKMDRGIIHNGLLDVLCQYIWDNTWNSPDPVPGNMYVIYSYDFDKDGNADTGYSNIHSPIYNNGTEDYNISNMPEWQLLKESTRQNYEGTDNTWRWKSYDAANNRTNTYVHQDEIWADENKGIMSGQGTAGRVHTFTVEEDGVVTMDRRFWAFIEGTGNYLISHNAVISPTLQGTVFYYYDDALENKVSVAVEFDNGMFGEFGTIMTGPTVTRTIAEDGETCWFLWGDDVFQDGASQWHSNVVIRYTPGVGVSSHTFTPDLEDLDVVLDQGTWLEIETGINVSNLDLPELQSWEEWRALNGVDIEYLPTGTVDTLDNGRLIERIVENDFLDVRHEYVWDDPNDQVTEKIYYVIEETDYLVSDAIYNNTSYDVADKDTWDIEAQVTYYTSGNLRTAFPDYDNCVYTFLDEDYWGTTIPQGRIVRKDYPADDPYDREFEAYTYHSDTYNVKQYERKDLDESESRINEFYDEEYFKDKRMVIDSSENIIELGKIWNGMDNGWDSYVKKMSSDGTFLWDDTYTNITVYEYPTAITIDGNDNIITIAHNGSPRIRKYDPSGNLLWEEIFDGYPCDLVTDASGNIYIAGGRWDGGGSGTPDRFLTVKYDNSDTDPTVLWEAEYSTDTGGYTSGRNVNIDDSGNIVVDGLMRNTVTNSRGYRIIYNSDGDLLDSEWHQGKTIHEVGPDRIEHNIGRRHLYERNRQEYSYGFYEQHSLLGYFPQGIGSIAITDPGYTYYFLDESLAQRNSGIFDFEDGGDVDKLELTFDMVEGEMENMEVIKGIYSNGNTAWFLQGDNVYQDGSSQWHDNVVLEDTGAANWNVYEFNPGPDPFQPLITSDWTTVESIPEAEALSLPIQELGDWWDWVATNKIRIEFPPLSTEYIDTTPYPGDGIIDKRIDHNDMFDTITVFTWDDPAPQRMTANMYLDTNQNGLHTDPEDEYIYQTIYDTGGDTYLGNLDSWTVVDETYQYTGPASLTVPEARLTPRNDQMDIFMQKVGEMELDYTGEGVTAALLDTGIVNGGHAAGTASVMTSLFEGDLIDLDVFGDLGQATPGLVSGAIRYAADMGAKVIAMPFTMTLVPDIVKDAIGYAMEKGSMLIAAAGNEGSEIKDTSLAAQEGVITVGSVNNDGTRSSWSNYGSELDILAPWDVIDNDAGTSFSTAFVSGIASLMLSNDPSLTGEDVLAALKALTLDFSKEMYKKTFKGVNVEEIVSKQEAERKNRSEFTGYSQIEDLLHDPSQQ